MAIETKAADKCFHIILFITLYKIKNLLPIDENTLGMQCWKAYTVKDMLKEERVVSATPSACVYGTIQSIVIIFESGSQWAYISCIV